MWRSRRVTKSVKEGLWWPIFLVFRVRIESFVRWALAGCGSSAAAGSLGIGGLQLFSPLSSSLWPSRASSELEDVLLRERV